MEEAYVEGSDWHAQEMLARFVSFVGLVYHIDPGVFASEPPGLRNFRRVVAGVDWGVTSPGCILVVGEHQDGSHWLLDEHYERGMVTHGNEGNDWATVAEHLQRKWGIDKFLADPEDANAILGWRQRGLPVVVANNKRLEGVRQCQTVAGNGKLRVVEGNCPNWCSEVEQYHWRMDRDGEPLADADPAKEFDHAMDPWRYAEMYLAQKGNHEQGEAQQASVSSRELRHGRRRR